MKSMLRTPLAQAVLAALVASYLRFALRTTRWSLDGAENYQPYATGAPVVCAFWHEFLPALPAIFWLRRRMPGHRLTQMHTLVSQHRDGRLIGEIVRRFGILPVHGSSTRGGAAGVRGLLALLKKGEQIGITPDGPQGPRRRAAAGVAQLAALAGVPVLPVAARTSCGKQLRSWDRMRIPLPFGRGIMVFGPVIAVPRQDWESYVPIIADALNRAADRAELLCPG